MDLSYNLKDATFSVAPAKKYTIEDVLEMLGGYTYFDEEQVLYTFHKLQGEEEKANYYLDICREKALKMQEKADRMKAPEDIEPLEVTDETEELTNEMVSQ